VPRPNSILSARDSSLPSSRIDGHRRPAPPSTLSSLEEIRGVVAHCLPQPYYRQRIYQLFRGSTDGNWLELELVDCFEPLCEIESGIQFLHQMHKKMPEPIRQWTNGVFAMMKMLVSNDCGCLLMLDALDFGSISNFAAVAGYIFTEFPRLLYTSDTFRELFYRLVFLLRTEFELLVPLIEFNWLEQKQFACLFATFLLGITEPMYFAFCDSILASLVFYSYDSQLHEVVGAIVVRGPQRVRDAVFSYIISIPDCQFRVVEGLRAVARRVAQEATRDQCDQLLAKVARSFTVNAPNVELLVVIMSVCPLREKAAFICQNRNWVTNKPTRRLMEEVYRLECEILLRGFT
jgi:hypothetical protein